MKLHLGLPLDTLNLEDSVVASTRHSSDSKKKRTQNETASLDTTPLPQQRKSQLLPGLLSGSSLTKTTQEVSECMFLQVRSRVNIVVCTRR